MVAASLAATLLLAAGCSMFRLAYNNVEIGINWMLDGYFDLHGEQHALLKSRLESLHAWHRSEELPLYVDGLRAVQARARQPLQRGDLEWVVDMSKKRYERLVREAAPGAADLLVTITDDQIQSLEKKYARENKKFAKEHKLNGTPDEQRKARSKKVLAMIEDWVGNLSDDQETALRQSIDNWPLNYALVLEDKQRRQREFVLLLEKNRDAGTLAAKLQDWMINYEQGRSPEYAAYSRQRMEHLTALVLQTDRLLKAKQRAHFIDKLEGYVSDFSALARPRLAGRSVSGAIAADIAR